MHKTRVELLEAEVNKTVSSIMKVQDLKKEMQDYTLVDALLVYEKHLTDHLARISNQLENERGLV